MNMFNLDFSVILLISLCCNHLQYTYGNKQVMTWSHKVIPKSIVFTNKYSFSEGNLVYAICDSNHKSTTTCKVIQEKYPYKNITYSCPVTLENNRNNEFLTIVVAALGKDKAVLIWKYKDNNRSTIVTIGTINLQNCMMNRVKIPNSAISILLELYMVTKFVAYDDDSFAIFYHDPRSEASDPPLYRMVLDGNGNVKSEPRIVRLERGRYLSVSSVATGTPYKGHVYVRKHLMDLSGTPTYYLWLLRYDGKGMNLAEYNGFPRSYVSAENNFISLCYKPPPYKELLKKSESTTTEFQFTTTDYATNEYTTPEPEYVDVNSEITCTQYDAYGNIIFTTNLTDTRDKIETLTSYNLPEGGMLIMYGRKKGTARENYRAFLNKYNLETVFEMVRIDPDGMMVGSLPTQQLEIPTGMVRNTYIHKSEDKGYCGTVVVATVPTDLSLKTEYPAHLTILSHCFSDYDF